MATTLGMLKTLGAGAPRTPWERALLLALALQLRSAWALLDMWVSFGGQGPFWRRLQALPAHPDWHFVAIVQSLVTAFVAVALARRWRAGWVLVTASILGAVAWGVVFAQIPDGLAGFVAVFRPMQETFAMIIVLTSVAAAWRWLGPWTAVPVAALAGGLGAASIRLVFSHTIWGVSWPDDWRRDLPLEVCAVALLMTMLTILRGTLWREAPGTEADTPRLRRLNVTVGLAGLLALALVHLVAGRVLSGWTWADSSRLVWTGGLLAAATAAAIAWGMRTARD